MAWLADDDAGDQMDFRNSMKDLAEQKGKEKQQMDEEDSLDRKI